MGKMEDLRAGVAEMRSVARRLNQWADDLEASFRGQGEEPTTAGGGNIVRAEVSRNKQAPQCGVAPIEAAEKPLSLPEVRAILAEKCAAGFGTQVKALIESYGASSLKGVPAERYGELLEAVKGLGDADAG